MSFSTISADKHVAMSKHPRERVHDLKCELAQEVLRSFGSLRLRVNGCSMLPAIWPGDVLRLERTKPSDLCKGDIVLFSRDRRLFAHRILETDGSTVVTRGDSLPHRDPVVAEDELLGRVVHVERNGKCFQPITTLSFSQRAIAALVRSDFAARVITGVHGLRQTKGSQS